MKKLLLLSFLAFTAVAPSFGQRIVEQKGPLYSDTCYARTGDVHTRVLPPETFLAQRKGLKPAANRATIIVTYSGFTPEAQAAFQYAVDIWQSVLISDVPIRINATWTKLDDGVLGQAGAANYYTLNGFGERISNATYPVALAEKIVGFDINDPTAPDIRASFGSTFNWYLGTDGVVPAGQYDLVSVVLHELGHGLGFLSSKNYVEATKRGNFSSIPIIFDDYIENGAGLRLADTRLFANPSVELGTAFTSNDAYFNSPLARAVNNDQRPRLYAPTAYAGGSTLSHLDENTYGPGDPNSLMSPQFAPSEAIHNPGPIMLRMFDEIGWFNTRITHTPYTDTETPRAFPVVATVASDGTTTPGSVKLNYAFNNGPLTAVTMTATNTANQYTATIPNPGSGVRVSYYIEASDNETQRIYTAPGRNPFSAVSNSYSFFVGPDVVAPTVAHTPPSILFPNQLPYTITVQASDNIGVASVTMEYSVNGVARAPKTLTASTTVPNTYTTTLGTDAGPIVAGNVITYRIVVKDVAATPNQTLLPATGYFTVPVGEYQAPRDSYVNTFDGSTPAADFGGSFSITQPTGFANKAVHSPHPYLDGTSSYYYLLVPITVKADAAQATMKFDEVVLVEPGTAGSTYGTAAFYDYVVVEGSTNGTTWTPLADGYDSRANATWLSTYNSGFDADNNSTGVGTAALYVPRTLNLRDKFAAGAVVRLRFRIYGDGDSHGWGWAIDNLNIQNNSVTASSQALRNAGLSVFPNPTAGQFTLQTRFDKPVANLEVVVRNVLGQEVLRQVQASVKGQLTLPLDLTKCANGFYSVSLTADGETATRKVLLNK